MIVFSSRHLHTPIDTVEEWDIDKLIDYFDALKKVLRVEAPRKGRSS